MMFQCTAIAPTNIAVIKYWGKKSVPLNTPLNSSLSITISLDDLQTKTTIVASPTFTKHELWLNGVLEERLNKRVLKVMDLVLELADYSITDWRKVHFRIISENSFPTAAGLASSASGYACLVKAFTQLMNCNETFPGHFSTIARQGSGSASRSLYGGLVEWQEGKDKDGMDSMAVMHYDDQHWSDLQSIICVVNDKKKETSSTLGMQTTVQTSRLLEHRVAKVVEERMVQIKEAYRNRDFEMFAKIAMMDSNQFHATCVDTYPPIFYLNETSQAIIHMVHVYNDFYHQIRAGYTFDAGPNAVLLVERDHSIEFLALLMYCFPNQHWQGSDSFIFGLSSWQDIQPVIGKLNPKLLTRCTPKPNCIKHVYHTQVGPGAKIVPDAKSLCDELGNPKPRKDVNLQSCQPYALAFGLFATALFSFRKWSN